MKPARLVGALTALVVTAASLMSVPSASAQPAGSSAAPRLTGHTVVPSGWTAVGAPLPKAALALVRYRGAIYAGGVFGLASWNGTEWKVWDSDTTRIVHSLAVGPDGVLYVAGEKSVGQSMAGFVAAWQNGVWKDLGISNSINGSAVWDIAIDSKGRIYAGGLFTDMGGVQASQVAMYDGKGWSALPGPLTAITPPTAMTIGPGDSLYVGAFVGLGNSFAYGAALKNGQWSLLNGLDYKCPGLNPCMGILSMAFDNQGTLHAAGQFMVGSTLTGYATWDGSAWNARPTNGMTLGTSLALDGSGTPYAALGTKPGGDSWVIARMGDPITALGTPSSNAGTYTLMIADGVAYAAFSTTDPGDNTVPWQVASFALPSKAKASSLPRNIRFITPHNGKPTVAWKAPAFLKPKSYAVQYRMDSKAAWQDATILSGRRQAVLPRSLAGERIQIRVHARGAAWATVWLIASRA